MPVRQCKGEMQRGKFEGLRVEGIRILHRKVGGVLEHESSETRICHSVLESTFVNRHVCSYAYL